MNAAQKRIAAKRRKKHKKLSVSIRGIAIIDPGLRLRFPGTLVDSYLVFSLRSLCSFAANPRFVVLRRLFLIPHFVLFVPFLRLFPSYLSAQGLNPGLTPTAPSGRIRFHEKTRN
jgi:hypothetical protein